MPIPIPHLAVKPPVLSEGRIAEAKRDFLTDVNRELLVSGADLNDPHIAAVLAEMPAKLTVQSTTMGPSVKYTWKHGGPVGSVQAAAEVIERAQARASLASLGPDPREQAAKRLIACGVTEVEAMELVESRLERKPDGHVVAYKADGSILRDGPKPVPGRQYAPEELAAFADSNDAVMAVVRAILAEREVRMSPNTGVRSDIGSAF